MRAVAYIRLSKGDTIEGQRAACMRLIEGRDLELVEEIVDVDTSAAGGRKPRPGFERLLKLMADGTAEAVVARHWDRLERNRRDSLRLIETGQTARTLIALVHGSDLDLSSADGRHYADGLASSARREIEIKSERQIEANEQAATEGRRVGGRRAFGFELDGTHRELEAAAVRWAYGAVLAGVSLGAVAREWNARGLNTPQGTRTGDPSVWSSATVSRCLRKASNAGLRSHRGVVVGAAQWVGLVDEETWHAVQAVLQDPARNTQGGPVALLTGVATCGAADCDLTVHSGGGNAAERSYRVYRCRSMKHVSRRADVIDAYVGAVVVEILSRPDAADLLVADDRGDATELRAEADRLRTRLDGLADAYAQGQVTLSQLTRATEALRGQLVGVESRMVDTGRLEALQPLLGVGDVESVWDGLGTDRRRAVVGLLMRVRIMPVKRGTRTFDPASVEITPR